MTLEEFLCLPEEKPALEFEPDGTVAQKMSPKGRHSRIQVRWLQLVNGYAEPLGVAMAFSELRTIFGGASYVPDVSVYRFERIPVDANGELNDSLVEPPDVAIEIVSPGQSVTALVRKSVWYVEHGVTVALVVDPDDRSILIFRREQSPRAARAADAVDLTDVLPGFQVTAEQVFESLRLQPSEQS
jgi:Uma2 family endonuclease